MLILKFDLGLAQSVYIRKMIQFPRGVLEKLRQKETEVFIIYCGEVEGSSSFTFYHQKEVFQELRWESLGYFSLCLDLFDLLNSNPPTILSLFHEMLSKSSHNESVLFLKSQSCLFLLYVHPQLTHHTWPCTSPAVCVCYLPSQDSSVLFEPAESLAEPSRVLSTHQAFPNQQ